jgi:hypothetical protein
MDRTFSGKWREFGIRVVGQHIDDDGRIPGGCRGVVRGSGRAVPAPVLSVVVVALADVTVNTSAPEPMLIFNTSTMP